MISPTRSPAPQLFDTEPAAERRRRPAHHRIIRLIRPWVILRGRHPFAHWCPNEPGPNGTYIAACGATGLPIDIPHGDRWVACAHCHDRMLGKARRAR